MSGLALFVNELSPEFIGGSRVSVASYDYRRMREIILEEADVWDGEFDIEHEIGDYLLRVTGNVVFSFSDSGGDRYITPKELIERYKIKVQTYQCLDLEGELVASDFDPKNL